MPGFDDALPQINLKAPALKVKSEQPLRIDLDQYVVALAGSRVHITDSASVKATHANGAPLVVDDHTLLYTSAARYFGPASITFEVTDGRTASDPNGHVAILTLAIDVQPRDNQPPAFVGGVVDFEQGQQKELDLVRLTNYPYPDVNELAYTVLSPDPVGFTYQLDGQRLLVTANESTATGSTSSISIGVKDAVNDGLAGKIQLQVVPSTRPLAKPIPDTAVAKRGQTTTVDVLSNDQANNPFPDTPLRVIDIRGIDGGALPAGRHDHAERRQVEGRRQRLGVGTAHRRQLPVRGGRRHRRPGPVRLGQRHDLDPGCARSGQQRAHHRVRRPLPQGLVGARPVQQLADHRVRPRDDQRVERRADLDDRSARRRSDAR